MVYIVEGGFVEMNTKLGNEFCEMSKEEMQFVDGGVIPVAIGVACLGLFGVGFTAGVTMGIKKWF